MWSLSWHRAVLDHLRQARPPCHTSVVAVASALLASADPDGSNVWPSQATICEATGLHRSTVAAALDYLQGAGFVDRVGYRARGVREWRLTAPVQLSDHPTSDVPVLVEPTSERFQLSDGSTGRSAQMPDDPTSTSPDVGSSATTLVGGLRTPPTPPLDDLALAEAVAGARRDAASDPRIRSPEAVGRHRFSTDPETYRDLVRARWASETAAACPICAGSGVRWFRLDGSETDRGDPGAIRSERCEHAVDGLAMAAGGP